VRDIKKGLNMTDVERPEWNQAWASWAKEQGQHIDWVGRLEMRRRIIVRAATNGNERLRRELFLLIATAGSVAADMKRRDADENGMTDRDIEALAEQLVRVCAAVPAPMRGCESDIPF
jgi:hypothetical protein